MSDLMKAIAVVQDENEALRAEVERLTRERDEAIAHKDQVIQDAIEMLGRTGHHREMSFAEFVEAGGGECPICLKRERDEARAQAEGLAKALADAIECVESWGAYADVYFQEKHNLAGDLVRLRAALPKEADRE